MPHLPILLGVPGEHLGDHAESLSSLHFIPVRGRDAQVGWGGTTRIGGRGERHSCTKYLQRELRQRPSRADSCMERAYQHNALLLSRLPSDANLISVGSSRAPVSGAHSRITLSNSDLRMAVRLLLKKSWTDWRSASVARATPSSRTSGLALGSDEWTRVRILLAGGCGRVVLLQTAAATGVEAKESPGITSQVDGASDRLAVPNKWS